MNIFCFYWAYWYFEVIRYDIVNQRIWQIDIIYKLTIRCCMEFIQRFLTKCCLQYLPIPLVH